MKFPMVKMHRATIGVIAKLQYDTLSHSQQSKSQLYGMDSHKTHSYHLSDNSSGDIQWKHRKIATQTRLSMSKTKYEIVDRKVNKNDCLNETWMELDEKKGICVQ